MSHLWIANESCKQKIRVHTHSAASRTTNWGARAKMLPAPRKKLHFNHQQTDTLKKKRCRFDITSAAGQMVILFQVDFFADFTPLISSCYTFWEWHHPHTIAICHRYAVLEYEGIHPWWYSDMERGWITNKDWETRGKAGCESTRSKHCGVEFQTWVGGGTNRHKGIMWRVQLNKRTICTSTAWWVYFMHFLLMMLLHPFFHIWASTVCTHLLRSMSATSARACKRLGSSCWCWELELYAVASI